MSMRVFGRRRKTALLRGSFLLIGSQLASGVAESGPCLPTVQVSSRLRRLCLQAGSLCSESQMRWLRSRTGAAAGQRRTPFPDVPDGRGAGQAGVARRASYQTARMHVVRPARGPRRALLRAARAPSTQRGCSNGSLRRWCSEEEDRHHRPPSPQWTLTRGGGTALVEARREGRGHT